MKTLIQTILPLFVGVAAFAGTNDLVNVIENADVQAALGPEAHSVTIENKGPSEFLIKAKYDHQICALSVVFGDLNNAVVVPLACRETASSLTTADVSTLGTPVYFQSDILPIFKARCTMCHGAGKPSPLDFTQYSVSFAKKDAILARVVDKKDMPPMPKLDAKTIALIEAWVKGGALDKP